MARKILPLFSLFIVLIFTGCGGNSAPLQTISNKPPVIVPTPTPTPIPVSSPTPSPSPTPTPIPTPTPVIGTVPQVTITSDSVFNASMIGQDWQFVDGFGNTTHILVEAPQAFTRTNADGSVTQITYTDTTQVSGRTGNNIVLHFANKSSALTYWGIGVKNAELWFPLHQNDDSSWRSTSSLINFPDGCSFCPAGPFIFTFQVSDDEPGMPLPYLIVPPTITTGQTPVNETRSSATGPAMLTFDNIPAASGQLTGPTGGEYWRTDFFVTLVDTPIYSGPAIMSEQFEGQCGHERWYFAPGFGIVEIESFNDGGEIKHDPDCRFFGDPATHDPRSTIKRTN